MVSNFVVKYIFKIMNMKKTFHIVGNDGVEKVVFSTQICWKMKILCSLPFLISNSDLDFFRPGNAPVLDNLRHALVLEKNMLISKKWIITRKINISFTEDADNTSGIQVRKKFHFRRR